MRTDRVHAALVWLKANNSLYQSVQINEAHLLHLDNSMFLLFYVKHIISSENQQYLQSCYNNIMPPNEMLDSLPSEIPFENIVIANVDCNMSSNELCAAAV